MAISKTEVSVELQDGLTVHGKARGHEFIIDEPESDGGADKGITPVEALFGGLGACKSIVARVHAENQGIQLNGIKIDVSGSLDPDGFLDINPDVKIGFQDIKTTYHIDADNTKEEIEQFVQFIEDHCPVLDTIVNTPELSVEIK